MQSNTLPRALTWPVLTTFSLLLLLVIHLTFTWKVDQQWMMMAELSHPAFDTTPAEQKQIWAEERAQKPFLFLFMKAQLTVILDYLLVAIAILLITYGLGYLLQSNISKRVLASASLITLLPTGLYQGYTSARLLATDGKVQQHLTDLNPWSLNALWTHLPLHHPQYELMNLLSCQLLLGMCLTLWFLRKLTQATLLNCSLLAFLPATLLVASKFLLQ